MIALPVVMNEDEEAIVKVEKLQTSSSKSIMYCLSDSDVTGRTVKVEKSSTQECNKLFPSAAEFRRGKTVTSACPAAGFVDIDCVSMRLCGRM